MFVVPIEERRFGIEPYCRAQGRVLKLLEIVARLAALAFAQLPRDAYAPLAIYRDEPAIEGAVVCRRKQQAICRVVPVLAVLAPRLDVACREQARIGDPSDAAGLFVIGEHRAAEEVLANALIDERLCGGLALIRFEPEFAALFIEAQRRRWWLELADLGSPQAFRPRDETGPVLAELSVGCAIQLGCTVQAFTSAVGDLGIEAGEVAQLHRDRAFRAPERSGELLDFWIARVQLSKRQLEIEIQCEHRLLFAPAFP